MTLTARSAGPDLPRPIQPSERRRAQGDAEERDTTAQLHNSTVAVEEEGVQNSGKKRKSTSTTITTEVNALHSAPQSPVLPKLKREKKKQRKAQKKVRTDKQKSIWQYFAQQNQSAAPNADNANANSSSPPDLKQTSTAEEWPNPGLTSQNSPTLTADGGQSSKDKSTIFGQLTKGKDNEEKESDLTSKPGRKMLAHTECISARFSTSAELRSLIDRQSKPTDYTNQELEEQRGKERKISSISLQSNQPPQYRLAAGPNGPPLIHCRER
ncbi:hypothetical protein NDU88_000843 [Pleurodeles waltl]|uniref:Uncharacterized protein n=1 Tax=Pleurodeles waltl TaxID=8319 RepID=A0AAV7V9J2_PLEWA|nr:hypothetical protein NDU88_000843 [Pleurodeles waltl]